MAMPVSASAVAAYYVTRAHESGDPISNLKLQKLLYYAQAWRLALEDKPLFPERLEAWVHGPVVPPVYGEYKNFTWQPIMAEPPKPEFDPEVVEHLEEVFRVYGPLTAVHLEQLTHRETPWREARGALAPDVPSNAVINHDSMKNFYRDVQKRAEENQGAS